MSLEILLSMVLVVLFYLQCGDGRMELSIKDFTSGANNTNADYSQAFKDAWKTICEDESTSLVIHANETYTIQPQVFQGPCASRNLHIQIDGKIEAPKTVKEWGAKEHKCWLCFTNVTGLVLNGSGVLDAHGEAWWSSVDHSHRPRAVDFNGSSNIISNGLTQMNSPKNHISVSYCTNVTLSNLHLIAPEHSPNTDGVDIAASNKIQIFSSSIQTGDDCVAINGGSYDINITHVACGPGHGISIGSLGKGGIYETVENVTVSDCSFNGTQNGARIKTWPGGQGFAKNILYENITLINAKYPIIIDQHYCNSGHNCTSEANSAVKVSNVTFKNFKGTCAYDDVAIKLDCDEKVRCHDIVMEDIDITSSILGKPLTSYCQFADIVSHFVSVDISGCDEEPEPPTPYPQPLIPALPPGIPLLAPSPFPQPPRSYPKPPRSCPKPPTSYPKPLPPAESPTPFPQPLIPAKPRRSCPKPPRSYPKPPRSYTIRPQLFQGPCVSRNIHIQIDGKIEAPAMVKDWGRKKSECWLCFEKVTGLVLSGSGLLNSHGETWWPSADFDSRPQAVRFSGCQDILYNGLTQMNSPRNHISISDCTNVTLSNIHLIAPKNSPNTDGIDISFSRNIHILSSSIKTGDDCVAIRSGSYDINITDVACGPGHGISVGSLGKGGENTAVQNVNVRHCTFTGTQNAARIKTWPGGRGFAKNILYENITLINSKFPIIIDQQYCFGDHCKPVPGASAVKVSDVTFKYFKGTCADAAAIKLDCDKKTGCDNIVMEHINITSSSLKTPLTSYCKFAHVVSHFVSIDIKCDFHEDPQSLSLSPQPFAPFAISPTPDAQPPAPTAQTSTALS